jgi:hypothetical protein
VKCSRGSLEQRLPRVRRQRCETQTRTLFLHPLPVQPAHPRTHRLSGAAETLINTTPLDCYLCVRVRGQIAALRHDASATDHWFAEALRLAPSLPSAESEWGEALLARGDLEQRDHIVPGNNAFEGHRTIRIYNLLARGASFAEVPVLHRNVLPIVEGVLDDGCLVSSLSSISIDPGETAQPRCTPTIR